MLPAIVPAGGGRGMFSQGLKNVLFQRHFLAGAVFIVSHHLSSLFSHIHSSKRGNQETTRSSLVFLLPGHIPKLAHLTATTNRAVRVASNEEIYSMHCIDSDCECCFSKYCSSNAG